MHFRTGLLTPAQPSPAQSMNLTQPPYRARRVDVSPMLVDQHGDELDVAVIGRVVDRCVTILGTKVVHVNETVQVVVTLAMGGLVGAGGSGGSNGGRSGGVVDAVS